ncbi:hypothetical protein TNCV_4435411 [Trichonephila clavipes]|nr:hypothetical protein TNCV_4435411 [Trichonephila clavipes]
MLGRCIAARPRSPATVRDLEIALLEEWNSIPQSLIDNLIASMANRSTQALQMDVRQMGYDLVWLRHPVGMIIALSLFHKRLKHEKLECDYLIINLSGHEIRHHKRSDCFCHLTLKLDMSYLLSLANI